MPGNIINLTPADIAQWPAPNYDDPHRRHWLPPYAVTLCSAATLMVATRLWIRARKHAGGLGLDDILLVCGWLCLLWFTALAIINSEVYMTSRHMWDIPIATYESIALVTWIAELAFLLCSCFTKVSVLMFYRRLVDLTVSKYWIWTVMCAISFTIAYSLAFILLLVFNCSPTEAYWKSFNPSWKVEYTCVDTTVVNLLAGVLSIVSDLYSVILPCLMTRHLRLPAAQKLGLFLVFSLGLLAVLASSVRTYWLYKVGHSSDVSTSIFYVFIWAQLELSLGIMCTSLPSLRVLLREYLSNPFSNFGGTLPSTRRPRMSDEVRIIREQGIMGVSSADLENQRVHYKPKHTPHSSTSTCDDNDVTGVKAPDAHETTTTRASWTNGILYLVTTPEQYESYNLHNMEKYRKSTHTRENSRSTKTQSGSSRKEISISERALSSQELDVSERSWFDSKD
ncbi:hypothetical protein CERZMDRAFT_102763 [Cercospora zeae-maydis SCOH1-5]|uniref:Rhodopsin domain-containing protein n=1 Tax=Cercospora zeae-maydis SCOH1-5 TaxID=717836 RepID=A0A6A6F025_9PEZI|nr:hypothetical protein CERZMDRAFT_102763 [Cercospora zeae-maydis SCOH1-5]